MKKEFQRTLVLLKPDCLCRGLTKTILNRLKNCGLKIERKKKCICTSQKCSEHYKELRQDKPQIYELVKDYMANKKIIALIMSGENAIQKVRDLCGKTKPEEADTGTIRGDFGEKFQTGVIKNLIHCSDSEASAKKEIKIWF